MNPTTVAGVGGHPTIATFAAPPETRLLSFFPWLKCRVSPRCAFEAVESGGFTRTSFASAVGKSKTTIGEQVTLWANYAEVQHAGRPTYTEARTQARGYDSERGGDDGYSGGVPPHIALLACRTRHRRPTTLTRQGLWVGGKFGSPLSGWGVGVALVPRPSPSRVLRSILSRCYAGGDDRSGLVVEGHQGSPETASRRGIGNVNRSAARTLEPPGARRT